MKHGMNRSRLYVIWNDIKQRCYNKNHVAYMSYGGRGIVMCDEWKNDFVAFMNFALSNGYTDDLTTDRIDPNGGYTPSNVRFVSSKIQARNRRDNVKIVVFGEERLLADLVEQYGIKRTTLLYRISVGMPPEVAITKPVHYHTK